MSTPALTPLVILTVTWSRDKPHFSLLRESIQRSSFAAVPHHVIVQHEDLDLFREYPGIVLHSTADVLPPEVEMRRTQARIWQQRCGRRWTNLAGSLARNLNWPTWVRYTGWHTQQLSKLAFVAGSESDTVVIMDSDLVVTPYAQAADFLSPEKIVCYQKMMAPANIGGKVLNWQRTAHRLFGSRFSDATGYDGYYDTPFVMHSPSVRALFAWLENRYQKPWWRVLVDLPPRRWSEFGIYKQYLRAQALDHVEWRAPDSIGYLFDASDPHKLAQNFTTLLHAEKCHYITIHSQSSGRQLWSPDRYLSLIASQL